jgi:hypothetical protein
MNKKIEVLIDETCDAAFKESIIQGIKEYNMPYFGVWEDRAIKCS